MMLSNVQPKHDTGSQSQEYYTKKARGPLLDKVFSMRYRSYGAEKYIEIDGTEKFMDEYDSAPNCTSYLAYHERQAVASIRACVYEPNTDMRIPAMDVFAEEIDSSIGYDCKFAEINKFVVDPSFQRKGGLRARFKLFRAMAEEDIYNDTEKVIIAVRPNHVRFYRNIFDCEQISDVKEYPKLNFKTVLLLLKDLQSARNLVISKTNMASLAEEQHEPVSIHRSH